MKSEYSDNDDTMLNARKVDKVMNEREVRSMSKRKKVALDILSPFKVTEFFILAYFF